MKSPSERRLFASRHIAIMIPLGYASGLPLALSKGTLQAWLADTGVDIETIGLFSLVGLPYSLKFLWAPLMDRYLPPGLARLGRRRGWMLLTQLLLIVAIGLMAFGSPAKAPWILAAMAVSIAFLSASQDIAFDAYRTDVLAPKERGLGAAVSVQSYRLAMLDTGGFLLVIAERMGWMFAYLTAAARMLVGLFGTLLAPEPEHPAPAPPTLAVAVINPLREFLSRKSSWALLALVVLYKASDSLAGSLTMAFLIEGMEFSKESIFAVSKTMGLVASIGGGLLGGALMIKLGLVRSLLAFGVLQALSNFGFMALALVGKDTGMLALAVFIEQLSGGMGTTAFVALIMALCHHSYTASQFALLTALASVGGNLSGPIAGKLVAWLDWTLFFGISAAAALPGLALVWWLRYDLQARDRID